MHKLDREPVYHVFQLANEYSRSMCEVTPNITHTERFAGSAGSGCGRPHNVQTVVLLMPLVCSVLFGKDYTYVREKVV